MKIIEKINHLLKSKPKIPKCYKDSEFMYCWCGKCTPDDYPLPEDFKKILAIKITEDYKKLKESGKYKLP